MPLTPASPKLAMFQVTSPANFRDDSDWLVGIAFTDQAGLLGLAIICALMAENQVKGYRVWPSIRGSASLPVDAELTRTSPIHSSLLLAKPSYHPKRGRSCLKPRKGLL